MSIEYGPNEIGTRPAERPSRPLPPDCNWQSAQGTPGVTVERVMFEPRAGVRLSQQAGGVSGSEKENLGANSLLGADRLGT